MTPNASRKELLSISWQMKHNENKTFGGRGHLVWKIILNKRHHTQENNICKRTNDVRHVKPPFFAVRASFPIHKNPKKPGTRDSRELSRFLAQSRKSRYSRLSRLVEIQLPSLPPPSILRSKKAGLPRIVLCYKRQGMKALKATKIQLDPS